MRQKWLIAGILIVALLCLCSGIIFVTVTALAPFREAGINWVFFQRNNVSAESDEVQRLTVNGAANLSVDNIAGDISVIAGEGSEIVITAHKTTWGTTEADAQANLDALKVNITQDGDMVNVKVEQPETIVIAGSGRSSSVDFTITVPHETAVTLSTDSGVVTLSGTKGNADVSSQYGDITVNNLEAGLTVDTSSGNLDVHNVVAGNAPLTLHSDYGDITLMNASGGEIKVDASSGALSLNDIQARAGLNLSSGYGQIDLRTGNAASTNISAGSGSINLTDLSVTETLIAHSDYGDVSLSGVAAASYDLSSNSGVIKVDGASGFLKAVSSYGNLEVTNANLVNLDLSTESGTVTFSGSLGEGPHTIHSSYGGIELTIPQTSSLTIDLKTDYGRVRSDLPVTISGDLTEEHWIGTINGGGASLTVSTNSGDIILKSITP